MAELDVGDRPILMGRPVLEGVLHHAGATFRGDSARTVGAERVEHNDIVAPGQRLEAGVDIDLLVQSEHEHRNRHIPSLPIVTKTSYSPPTIMGSRTRAWIMNSRLTGPPIQLYGLLAITLVAAIVPFAGVLGDLYNIWNLQPEYSHGLIIPVLSAY